MIGKIYNVLFTFYNSNTGKNDYKYRPVLIVGVADSGDYVVFPISRVTKKEYLSADYDIEIDPEKYPNTNLTDVSYVRTHKRSIANRADIASCKCDLKTEYAELYTSIIEKAKAFDADLMEKAVQCTESCQQDLS